MDPAEQARLVAGAWSVLTDAQRVGATVVPPLLVSGVSLVATAAGLLAARLAGGRLAPDAPWTEVARVTFPVRRLAAVLAVVLPFGFALWLGGDTARLAPGSPVARGLVAAAAAWAGHRAAVALVGRRAGLPRGTTGEEARHLLAAALLRGPAWTAIGVIGLGVGAPWGAPDVAALVLAAMAFVAGQRGSGAELARLVGVGRGPSPRVRAALERAVRATGTRPRVVGELDLAVANAWAFPPGDRVLVTPRLLAVVDDDGLVAVLAHELGHLREPVRMRVTRMVVAGGAAAGVGLAVASLVRPEAVPRPAVIAAMLAVFGLVLLGRRVLRRAEDHADAFAAAAGEREAYARALEAIYRENGIPAVLPGAPHQSLHDRMTAAGAPPSWTRPRPPDRMVTAVVLAAVVGAVGLGWGLGLGVLDLGALGPRGAEVAVGTGFGRPSTLAALARSSASPERAAAWWGGAIGIAPDEPRWPAGFAVDLAGRDRCLDAVRALRVANALAEPRGGREAEPAIPEAEAAITACFDRLGR